MTTIKIELSDKPLPATGRYHADIRCNSIEAHVSSQRTDTPSIDLATDRDVLRAIHANFIHKVLKTIESLIPTVE
jgi:hypothetical protein